MFAQFSSTPTELTQYCNVVVLVHACTYVCECKAYARHAALYSYLNGENFLTILWTRLIPSSYPFPHRALHISAICISDTTIRIIVFYYPMNSPHFLHRIIRNFEGSCVLMVDPTLIAYFISTSLPSLLSHSANWYANLIVWHISLNLYRICLKCYEKFAKSSYAPVTLIMLLKNVDLRS